jgi:NAD-dependent SIR2 family protein deacetylase
MSNVSRLGQENISPAQQRLLESAKQSARQLVLGLHRIIDDDDILSGREDIHPQWLELLDIHREYIRSSIPSSIRSRIETFFDSLLPVDKSIRDLHPEGLNLCFLLGAGASKPAPSDIPTVKELLPELLERARRLDREDVTKLADYCERRRIDNIEDLLTAAQLATFCSRNPTVLALLNFLLYRGEFDADSESGAFSSAATLERTHYRRSRDNLADLSSVAFLQDTLQVLFGLLASRMISAKPNHAHTSIAEYTKRHRNSSIVTTNYDCCIDLALGENDKDFNYLIDFTNTAERTALAKPMKLIKLHGSLNWYYCETCQEVQLVDIRKTVRDFEADISPYTVIGICKDCGGQRRGLLVPPLAMKFDVAPALTPLLSEAKSAFERADLIVVVGFSFAEADLYISRMLSKSMQTSAGQKLLIVDPDPNVVTRVSRKFKASIPNFDVARVVRLSGDCAELLPSFLKGELVGQEQHQEEPEIRVEAEPVLSAAR